ncbi:hypothetical protein [Legionella brunensis]|uniref:Phasin protein n=1 Tax=Legionella brunensis TaxID=29422 RepID=A0A0W0SU91_9GAMM|nr:hypothetical protein [Legionella brunensis]KTC86851.1 hypothetical protein Lbru_0080 [Legionella brunensis]
MQPNYLSNWSSIMGRMQKPIQEMMELNTRALQNISYLKPEELSQIRKPEDLLDKQMKIFVENGHKALDYMQQTFAIFEEHLLSISKEVKEKSDQATKHAQTIMKDYGNNKAK